VSKLNDSEGEAEETRVSLAFSYHFGYLSAADTQRLDDEYDKILGQLVNMAKRAEQWLIS
jgi:four helix bundle protein